jgi:hypothetical protein
MRKITRPDVRNTNPEYWERVLKSHNLGTRQLGLQEDPDEDCQEQQTVSLEEAEEENERRPQATA